MKHYPSTTRVDIGFPMVVVSHHYEGEATRQLNDELAQLIRQTEKNGIEQYKATKTATQGGFHTTPDFLERTDPAIQEYKNKILIPGVISYLKSYYQFMTFPADEVLPGHLAVRGWGNILRAGEWNAPHNHITTHNRLSSVYYVSAPERPYPEGILEFSNPNPLSNQHGCFGSMKFHPVAGDLIIFPCYLTHFSHPFYSGEERILVANDIRVNDPFDHVRDNSTYDKAFASDKSGI